MASDYKWLYDYILVNDYKNNKIKQILKQHKYTHSF